MSNRLKGTRAASVSTSGIEPIIEWRWQNNKIVADSLRYLVRRRARWKYVEVVGLALYDHMQIVVLMQLGARSLA